LIRFVEDLLENIEIDEDLIIFFHGRGMPGRILSVYIRKPIAGVLVCENLINY